MLVYDNNLNNQHNAMHMFERRWFGPYAVTKANENDTCHLTELHGTRLAVPVAGKRIKAFKKKHEDESDLWGVDDGDDQIGADGDSESDG